MLDFFLILGQIPGTNLQLTFTEVSVIAVVLLGAAFLRLQTRPRSAKPRPLIWEALVSYEQPVLSLPTQFSRPSAEAQLVNTWLLWLDRHWRTVH